jgi:hypothetical protein
VAAGPLVFRCEHARFEGHRDPTLGGRVIGQVLALVPSGRIGFAVDPVGDTVVEGRLVVGVGALGLITFGWLQEPVIPALAVSLVFFLAGSYLIPGGDEPTMADLDQT